MLVTVLQLSWRHRIDNGWHIATGRSWLAVLGSSRIPVCNKLPEAQWRIGKFCPASETGASDYLKLPRQSIVTYDSCDNLNIHCQDGRKRGEDLELLTLILTARRCAVVREG